MNTTRKYLGILWIIIAAVVAYYGLTVMGIPKISSGKQEDLVFGIIICFILLPLVVGGLLVFGIYALQSEYGINSNATNSERRK